MRRKSIRFTTSWLGLLCLAACDQQESLPIDGYPSGPYHMTVSTVPSLPVAGEETIITTQLNYTKNGQPVGDLDTLHQRLVHNFITKLDFTNFAHIHNEDFRPLTEIQKENGTLSFPYTFPSNGTYRMVSEFTHHRRSWTKHFDIPVGNQDIPSSTPRKKTKNSVIIGDYHAELSYSEGKLIAGEPTELKIVINENNSPVNNLQLHLGSEAHVAIWRTDGEHFGHTHSYTPKMREIMATMKRKNQIGRHSTAAMRNLMYTVMSMPGELNFKGPSVPLLHTFPEPGTYVVFIECAPDGQPIVFDFTVNVALTEHDSTHEDMPSHQ